MEKSILDFVELQDYIEEERERTEVSTTDDPSRACAIYCALHFDEMDYCPMNLSGGDPVKEAIAWRDRLRYELDLLLDEKSAIECRAVKEFAEKLKRKAFNKDMFNDWAGATYVVLVREIDELLKEYEK